MASVGLLYVGAVLIVNGLMLLGRVDARAAAPLNFFVGGLQVFTPTYLIVTSGGDPDVVLGASGLYLFGFTYLYVGLNLTRGLDGTGLGWFSAFVAGCAVVYAGLNFGRLDDPAFGVIWLYWAVLWALFFLVLGLKREELTRFTGLVAVVAGVVTCAVPAFLLMTGVWAENVTTAAIVLAVVLLLSLALFPAFRDRRTTQLHDNVAEEQPAPSVPAHRRR
ncbi:transporter [Modestobacter caceresii]|uniref:Transporter n=1 Tax=Modestobacter caceresii TaxID=1522368 RepID=A0A098Y830_9ACTN|nr:AmiS/UreI family transporter [Modestobacter caceresii]KGH46600.1 transporter [Modestobacter caceresii]